MGQSVIHTFRFGDRISELCELVIVGVGQKVKCTSFEFSLYASSVDAFPVSGSPNRDFFLTETTYKASIS